MNEALKRDLRKRLRNGLRGVAAHLTMRARLYASKHVDTGALRQAITYSDGPGLSVLWGISLRHAPHGKYLELGFRPHWVPARYIGRWMQRHRVGVTFRAGGKEYKSIRAVALGLYVGGPGSTLEYGGAGARGRLFSPGGRLMERTWATKGGRSEFLPQGKVGFPILRPTLKKTPKAALRGAFLRGYRKGGAAS